MMSATKTARALGAMLIVQILGLGAGFALLHPGTRSNYLSEAAGAAGQIKLATLILLAIGALTVAISVIAWPVFRRHNSAMALLLVVASVTMFVMQAVDNAHIMSMVALSERYLAAGSPAEPYGVLGGVVMATRRWAHYVELLAIDVWISLLYIALYRFSLVPRWLALLGLATVVLHFAFIVAPLFLGYPPMMSVGPAMAVGHLVLGGWLLVKGFSERVGRESGEDAPSPVLHSA
jgi:hypothetical protein